MALYHLHVKNISRGDGRSAVAAAAYRAGETLENAAEERLSQFAGRRDVLGAEIHLPADAPAWMGDRTALWNAVEAVERRKDARLAKEVEFSIPRELPRDAWFELARSMAAHFTTQGFVVDLAVHDDGTGHNPHAHLMLTTRTVMAAGFGQKLRAADRKTFLKDTRTTWQTIANAALAKAGFAVTIDAGSYAARGIEREPGERRPPDPVARRQRREEVASMVRDSDIRQAIDELATDPSARERYPTLTQRDDWPPRDRALGAVLALSPEARERKAYWREVDERANPSVLTNSQDQARSDDRREERGIDDAVNTLAGKLQAATLKQGEERRQAFAEGAREYQRLFDRVNGTMVRAGILKPENVRSWEQVSRAFRDPEFDEMLAEARRIEAKRNEPDRTLRATPAQIAALAKHERAEEERQGMTFIPRPAPGIAAAQARMVEDYEREDAPPGDSPPPPVPVQTRDGPPDALAYLAAQPAPARQGFEAAQDRMMDEYERDDRRPPDALAWLRQQAPAAPVQTREDDDQTRKRDRTLDREER